MTAIRLDRQMGMLALPEPARRASGTLSALGLRAMRWLRNRRAERLMSSVSDERLRDMGITRAEIARVVWHGRN